MFNNNYVNKDFNFTGKNIITFSPREIETFQLFVYVFLISKHAEFSLMAFAGVVGGDFLCSLL